MSETDIRMTVNGKERQVAARPDRTLLSVLREDLGLTGTKDGCSSGDCGACVVMMNGRVVNACMVLGPQAEGADIVTVEGIDSETGLHPIQRAFGETWAFQCGFCTPGMLISCFALLQGNSNPGRDEILEAVSGNFCRCTGYQAVVKAVEQAAAEMRSREATTGAQDD